MPAKSQAQRGLIFGKRNQYKTKAKTPDKWKWIWDEDWENKGKLPKKKKKNETVQNVIMEKYRARTVNEMYEEDVYGDPYVSDTTSPKQPEQPKKELGYYNGIKDPASVQPGERTVDYNDERGSVLDIFMKDNDPDLFAEIIEDFGDDPENYEDDTYLVHVRGREYGHFGGPGSVWFVYGPDGAYVPELKESLNESNDWRNDPAEYHVQVLMWLEESDLFTDDSQLEDVNIDEYRVNGYDPEDAAQDILEKMFKTNF